MPRTFKSPIANYRIPHFKTSRRPKSPTPKRHNYSEKAVTQDDGKSRCTYIHTGPASHSGKRCKNKLGLYPEFCELHTILIYNLYIAESNIPNSGNGLFAGPYGFKKGDSIGKYNYPWNSVKLSTLEKRCTTERCWDYIFCEDSSSKDTMCWDGLDIRSTLMRNINDGKQANNSYFKMISGDVHVIASRTIKPNREILVSYGSDYWKNRS